MDWDCWSRAFSAIRGDPSDAKRELKEFHHRVVSTRFVLVAHEASLGEMRRERGSSAPDEANTGSPRRRRRTTTTRR
jgi:hypothetical protein